MDAWTTEDVASLLALVESLDAHAARVAEFAWWAVSIMLVAAGYRLAAHFFSAAPSRRMYGGRL